MFNIDKKKFGAFVAALRKEKGITQKELSEQLCISDKAVSKWETGVSLPDIGMQFGSLFRPQKKKCLNFLWKQGVQNPVFAAIGEGIIFLPAMNLDKHRPSGHIRQLEYIS